MQHRVMSLSGRAGQNLSRAKSQDQGGWRPDARPAAMRRKKYRPQGMRTKRPGLGLTSVMACLGLMAAITPEVAGAESSARVACTRPRHSET